MFDTMNVSKAPQEILLCSPVVNSKSEPHRPGWDQGHVDRSAGSGRHGLRPASPPACNHGAREVGLRVFTRSLGSLEEQRQPVQASQPLEQEGLGCTGPAGQA